MSWRKLDIKGKFPRWHSGKNLPANAGDSKDSGLILGSGRSPREENGYPLQYPCLKNFMDRGAWQAIVHGVTKSWTQLSMHMHMHTHTHTHTHTYTHTHTDTY